MGGEQKQILEMVAEGKITADEGARLLEALEKGERRRRDHDSPARMSREKKRIIRERIRSGEIGGLEGLKDIGRMVRGAIRESIAGMDDDLDHETGDIMDDGGILEGPLDLEEGTRLVIRREPVRNAKGSLSLNGNPGSTLETVGDSSPEVRMSSDDGTVYLKWAEGDLCLSVPNTVHELMVRLAGGNVVISDIAASTSVKTKGGDVCLYGMTGDFDAKTMGGNLTIMLGSEWEEDSRVSTMGGNISLGIPRGTRARISARTLGGEVSVDEGLPAEYEGGHAGSARVSIDMSGGEQAPDLKLKTMGGNITVGIREEGPPDAGAAGGRRKKK